MSNDKKLRPPTKTRTAYISGYPTEVYNADDINAWLDSAVRVNAEHIPGQLTIWKNVKNKDDNIQAFLINIEPIKKQTREERAIELLRDAYKASPIIDKRIDEFLKEVDGGE